LSLDKDLINIKKLLEQKADKDSLELTKAYKKALDDVRKEIALLYFKHSEDGVLDTSKMTQNQMLNQIERMLKQQANLLGGIDEQITSQILKKTGEEAGLRTIYSLNKGLEIGIDTSLLNPKAIEKVMNRTIDGDRFSDRIWKNKAKLVSRVKKDVEKAIKDGDSIDKLASKIKKDFNVSAYESKRLIHTEVAYMQTEIQESIYEDTDVIEKVMWVASLDDKTRDDHQDYDGQIWDVNEPHPSPKDYINCRCTLVPIIEGFEATKRKDNSSKEIVEFKDYEAWVKEQ
jgi:SPP1 gp7 family putative phage head morphogenesis protein